MVAAYTMGNAHFPINFLNASLILSCQPGPSAWKCSRTSRSIRNGTCSLAPGTYGCFGVVGASTGFVVAALNAASAASRVVVVLRGLSGIFVLSCDVLFGGRLHRVQPAEVDRKAFA